jgi:hypothetical protein
MADGDRIIIGQANTASKPGNETSLSRNEGTASTVFVARNLNVGAGIHGESVDDTGVSGTSDSGDGVRGLSNTRNGVTGFSGDGVGMAGFSSTGTGVLGTSSNGTGVYGLCMNPFVGGISGRRRVGG